MTETKLSIKIVGWYEHPRTAEPEDCQLCHNADWADVIIEGICSKCLLRIKDVLEKSLGVLEYFASAIDAEQEDIALCEKAYVVLGKKQDIE